MFPQMFRQISLASNAPWVWGIQAQKPVKILLLVEVKL